MCQAGGPTLTLGWVTSDLTIKGIGIHFRVGCSRTLILCHSLEGLNGSSWDHMLILAECGPSTLRSNPLDASRQSGSMPVL